MNNSRDPLGFCDRPWLTGGMVLAAIVFLGLPSVFVAFFLALLYAIAVGIWRIANPPQDQAMGSAPPTLETSTMNTQPPPGD